jgi:ferredoxin-type protein NapH
MVAMAKDKPRTRISRTRLARWRPWTQAAFLLAWLQPSMLRNHFVCAPVFHCYSCPLATFACPIGVLATFSVLHVLPLVAIGTLVITGALVGSLICGWVCPFGFLQDLLGRIPAPKFKLPAWAGYTRYAVLVGLVAAVPYFFGEGSPWFICRLCPAGALEGAVPNVVEQAIAGQAIPWPGPTKIAILATFLVAAVFVWRPWCTLFCPLGAIYGVFNWVSVLFVGFRRENCNDCDLCRGRCRYRARGEQRAGASRCVRCLECTGCKALGVGSAFQRLDRR